MNFKKTLMQFGVLILFVFVMVTFVGQRTVVNGRSMESTLHDGDNLILDKISYRFTDPERYDVVVFPGRTDENGNNELFIKRIVGLPGETIEIKDGAVYVNGEELKDDIYAKDGYTLPAEDSEWLEVTLGENEYYCLGDNRGDSIDSRFIGPVTLKRGIYGRPGMKEIIGRIPIRIYPINDISLL